MKEKRSPTIKEVAALAGVAFSTAATALRGEGRIKAETRRRVQEAAKALGYRSNRAAAILASGRRGSERREVVAYVSHLAPDVRLRPGMVQRREEVLAAARRAGYSVREVELYGEDDPSRQLQAVYHQGIDGLVMGRFLGAPYEIAELDLAPFAVVGFERFGKPPLIHTVRHDVGQAVREAFSRLEQAGCQRIAAALHSHDPPLLDDRDRLAAYLESWRRSHGRRPPPEIQLSDPGEYTSVLEWFHRVKADGLILFSQGDYLRLREAGLQAPRDFQAIWLHRNFLPEPHPDPCPELAGFQEPISAMSTFALQLLDSELRFQHHGLPEQPIDTVFRCRWIPGRSLRET